MAKKYTHLFFDLDNTLWDFEKNSYNALTVVYNNSGLKAQGIDFNHFFEVYSAINKDCWQSYRLGMIGKRELMSLRFERTFNELGIPGIDPYDLNSQYLMELPNQKQLVQGTMQLLGYLKSKGYQMFIITNGFTEVQYNKLEATGIRTFFKKVFTSEQVNAPKPSRVIFEYAIKSAHARKSSSLMIGDEPEVDIKGALNIGIDAVYIGKNTEIELLTSPPKRCAKIYLLSSLAELTALL